MDIFDVLLQAGLITSAVVVYLLVFRRKVPQKGKYKLPGWNYPLKLLWARYAVGRWKANLRPTLTNEEPNPNQREGWDSVTIRATAPDGTALLLAIRKLCGRKQLAEVTVFVTLPNGTTYALPQHPDTAVGAWTDIEDGWSAGGLKVQVLEPELRLRLLYNGLLKRTDDGVIQHVTMHLTWVSVTPVHRHPEDLSTELAAEALAIEPWRDGKWPEMLGTFKDGRWLQFGAVQGRFTAYDYEGATAETVYVRARGVRERGWAEAGHAAVRRAAHVAAASEDGTLIMLHGYSYNNILTQCWSGAVRLPSYELQPVTATDLDLPEFCELPTAIPKAYTINVTTRTRTLKLIMRINEDGGRLLSGVPYQHEVYSMKYTYGSVYRTFVADIDGYFGTGTLELGYQHTGTHFPVAMDPSARLAPAPVLKWVTAQEAGAVGYCLPLARSAAACTDYVGGKCASLALLATLQDQQGYSVPPGFCLTIHALDKYLELNPEIKAAIAEIEVANKSYDEQNFKQKCEKATALFESTEIEGELKDDILVHLTELKKMALEQIGEVRFAVRSSAVGEDSEVLSAAGQNETILGCLSDDDVLAGVQKCWGSMFAFTSAYYRRQNGAPCLVGGGVCVQALVPAHAAGVMFTRHPAAGDPRRLLVTANYGLGESVVSGTVEPDTFIVHRDSLTITSTTLGSKLSRVTVSGDHVTSVTVSEEERNVPCLTEGEVRRLAEVGVRQDELWGAGRDIEWAFVGDKLYLLQARPITSLERWTEEELLHELDDPIMSDDEIVSFGNTGEVLPRPMTAMSNDVVRIPLARGIDGIVGKDPEGYDHSILLTHYRCALLLYTSIYRRVPKEVDVNIRMIEMAVHGHSVADGHVMRTAVHRRRPRWYDRLEMITLLIKTIMTSSRSMKSSVRDSLALRIGEAASSPQQLFAAITEATPVLSQLSYNHGVTSTASTSSQFIAMNVLLEGRTEFSPELCNEIGALLSSGDVLSAEVPHSIARLANLLEASGKYEEFRALKPEDGIQWLKETLPKIYDEVCSFLDQHGHRAIMEFDLSTKPWILRPEDMMKVLQALRASTQEPQKQKTDSEIIASLKSPQKASTRKVLSWVMPLCRRTVRHREGTKAHLILAIHKMRLAFLRLGEMMVKQWYLPNQDLIFFFRYHELKKYIEHRDPALLRKAVQRQQHYPKWCKLKFNEINTGWVSPLQVTSAPVACGDVTLHAASVCGGEVVARACVVNDLSEIDQLQQGDVLITHATDIGWSPYFPLITGIVTELGGLISHGAVIAREYGLPCIVGAANATNIFKTGDMVRLSGTKGTLERVLLEQNAAPAPDAQTN